MLQIAFHPFDVIVAGVQFQLLQHCVIFRSQLRLEGNEQSFHFCILVKVWNIKLYGFFSSFSNGISS